MKIQIQVLLHLVIISLLFGCKKYDLDGNLINFQRPEKRLIGDWESVAINEVGVIADTNITELLGSNNLRLDISFNEDYSVQIDNVGDSLSYSGDWEFNDDKSVLHMNLSNEKSLGPFYQDDLGNDYTGLYYEAYATLSQYDTIFFEANSYVDITDEVTPLVEQLMIDYVQWIYTGGDPFLNYNYGDDITSEMESYLNDAFSDEEISSPEDFDGFIVFMEDEWGIEVTYQYVTATISGYDDPNLIEELFNVYGISCDVFIGNLVLSEQDPIIIEWIEDNNDIILFEIFIDQLKEIDLYWEILELELDDLQAYQYRETDSLTVYDYSYLLRFEKID